MRYCVIQGVHFLEALNLNDIGRNNTVSFEIASARANNNNNNNNNNNSLLQLGCYPVAVVLPGTF